MHSAGDAGCLDSGYVSPENGIDELTSDMSTNDSGEQCVALTLNSISVQIHVRFLTADHFGDQFAGAGAHGNAKHAVTCSHPDVAESG